MDDPGIGSDLRLPVDLEPWFLGYFDDYDRLTSPERARRIEPMDRRLTEWLEGSIQTGRRLHEAWMLIGELIRRAPSDEILAFVAAGPLEEFVRAHAARFADRIARAP
jgi:hypothetical protein